MVRRACFGLAVLRAMAVLVVASLTALPVHAHEVRPGHIGIEETARDNFEIVWKQPVRDLGPGQVAGLGLRPVFPEIVCGRATAWCNAAPACWLSVFA